MRGFFSRLAYKFACFMQGRNGADSLYRAMFVAFLIVAVVRWFVFWKPLAIALWALSGALVFGMLFRCFSRNLYARRRENEWWLRLTRRVRGWGKLMRNRWRDRRTHVFRRCPFCDAVVRLPRTKKGKRVCNCPRCRRDFGVKIR